MQSPAYAAQIVVAIPAVSRKPVPMVVVVPNGEGARERARTVAHVIALAYSRRKGG